jgi:hypothetical protein
LLRKQFLFVHSEAWSVIIGFGVASGCEIAIHQARSRGGEEDDNAKMLLPAASLDSVIEPKSHLSFLSEKREDES